MFRKLLVPLDGSELAERALPLATRLVAATGGSLVLVRAVLGPPPTGQDWERQQQSAVVEAETYMRDVAQKIATRVPVSAVVPYGHAPAQILATAEADGADAILMTTRGRTGMAHLLFGSVAESILARATIPVLLIHGRGGEAPGSPFDPASARILVPLDGSALAEAALPIATSLLGAAGELVLLTVLQPPDHVITDEARRTVVAYIDQQEDAARREALDYLAGVSARLTASDRDLPITATVQIAGSPSEGILREEIERSIDLVVMATHGRTGLRRAIVGSVAGAVVRNGHAPALLVPAHAPAGAPVQTTR